MISSERPFGVHLYPYFEKAYEFATGQSASSFKYQRNVTFLSTDREVATVVIGFLTTIFSFRYMMMHTQKPFSLIFLFRIHNFLLTFISLALFLLICEQFTPLILNEGFFYSLCSDKVWNQKIELLFYMNYLSKVMELVDTLFIVARKKPLGFLHVYHHSLTMVLCYVQLNGSPPASYVPVVLNLGVHVLMYWYYFLATYGGKIWWKKAVTVFQIVQFILDLIVVYFCTYTYYAFNHFPNFPHMGDCAGSVTSAYFSCFLLTSYLFLFVDFFFKTYKNRHSANPGKTVGGKSK